MCRPPAMSADRPAASDGGLVVSHTRYPVGDRGPQSRCTSAFWQVHHGAGDLAAARRFTRPSRPRRRSIVQRRPTGEAVIPWPVVRGPMVVALSRSPPGRFGRTTASYVDCPQAAMGSRYRPGTAPGPASDRPSPLHPRRRSNSDHAGESTYSGRNRESRSRPGNSISRELTSLLNCITIMFLSVL